MRNGGRYLSECFGREGKGIDWHFDAPLVVFETKAYGAPLPTHVITFDEIGRENRPSRARRPNINFS